MIFEDLLLVEIKTSWNLKDTNVDVRNHDRNWSFWWRQDVCFQVNLKLMIVNTHCTQPFFKSFTNCSTVGFVRDFPFSCSTFWDVRVLKASLQRCSEEYLFFRNAANATKKSCMAGCNNVQKWTPPCTIFYKFSMRLKNRYFAEDLWRDASRVYKTKCFS